MKLQFKTIMILAALIALFFLWTPGQAADHVKYNIQVYSWPWIAEMLLLSLRAGATLIIAYAAIKTIPKALKEKNKQNLELDTHIILEKSISKDIKDYLSVINSWEKGNLGVCHPSSLSYYQNYLTDNINTKIKMLIKSTNKIKNTYGDINVSENSPPTTSPPIGPPRRDKND